MNDELNEAKCKLCGEPMPKGEEMFNYHGYSCPCPTTPKKKIERITGKKPEKIKVCLEPQFLKGYNQAITKYDSYLTALIEPLEKAYDGNKPFEDIIKTFENNEMLYPMFKMWNAIKTVVENHRKA